MTHRALNTFHNDSSEYNSFQASAVHANLHTNSEHMWIAFIFMSWKATRGNSYFKRIHYTFQQKC